MDGTYAPQSPDLSGFLSSPVKKSQPLQTSTLSQAQAQAQSQSQSLQQPTSYVPQSPVIPSAAEYAARQHQQQRHYQSYAGPRPVSRDSADYEYNRYMPPIPALPPAHAFHSAPSAPGPYYTAPPGYPPLSPQQRTAYSHPEHAPDEAMSTRASRHHIKAEGGGGAGEMGPHSPTTATGAAAPGPTSYRNPNPSNIEIRTKFPVARIKRIMQADEEVGKVAQVTPVAVSKALELFMIALVSGAAAVAKDKGGKRVTAQHLKHVVEADEQFDFLSDIVARVPDGPETADGRKRKEKARGPNSSDSEDEEDKKPKKGRGRRKKSDE